MYNEKMKIHYSSKSDEWETPQDFYDKLNKEFSFTLDPCCRSYNAKCASYFTPEDDGLMKSWQGHTVFMNPPYGRQIKLWMKKAYDESLKPNTVVVCLLPSRTDTKWFHEYCLDAEVRFIKGRLRFINRTFPSWREDGNFKISPACFPSCIVIFRGEG